MLKELVNYAEWLKKDFSELFEGSLTEGLHIGIEIKKENGSYSFTYKSKVYKKNEGLDEFLLELRRREIISKALGGNKGIIDKVIFSNNPYAIFFKIYFTKSEDLNKVFNKKEWKNFVDEYCNKKEYEVVKEQLLEKFVFPRLEILFASYENENHKIEKNIIGYYDKIFGEYMQDTTDGEINLVKQIKQYVEKELKGQLIKDNNFISLFIEDKNSKLKFESKFFDKEIRVNFLVDENFLEKAKNRYFSKMIFNVSDYNQETNQTVYGLSNFFNKAAEGKKVFNFHRTAFFKVNKLISIDWANILNEIITVKEKLPNPLPIFIDKNELNARVITIFNNDSKKGYKEIISELSKNYKYDIGNYYLINFTKTIINDFDYVPSFKFYLDEFYDINNLDVFDININERIENIFDIENLIDGNFFFKINRNSGSRGNILNNNYFSDKIDPGKGNEILGFILNNLYKYRKSTYDAIYKSRLYLIKSNIIREICFPVMRYEIAHDETDSKTKKSKNEKQIIKKLLIFLFLNKIFDKKNKNTGVVDMPSELPNYFENLKKLLKKEIQNFQTDEDFAFGLGQLIRYLLDQSESDNKNHSMFNPFLQKLNNYDLFIKFLTRTFQTYSYKIRMHYEMFDRLMSNVTSYKLNSKTLKDLELIIISGYFADSVIKNIINEKYNNNNNNKEDKNEQ